MATSPHDVQSNGLDFLDLISHELRQPLTAAQGSVITLIDRSDLTGEQKTKLLEITARNLSQLSSLIDSLRIFNDADRGSLRVVPASVLVEELFSDCAEDFPDTRTHRTLVTSCPPGLLINVDKTLFKQVVTNLVGNAMKFAPAGSTVTLSAAESGPDLLITVRDQGHGFPEHESERIFDKSVKLISGASGLGLGLYVARAIVRAHRGEIQARSAVGAGASFEVSIPG